SPSVTNSHNCYFTVGFNRLMGLRMCPFFR
ncbi:uncharacterized protein METZ01_LOCUS253612, partial [marine metagenome]